MKKFFLGALMMVGFAGYSFAQTGATPPKTTKPVTKVVTITKPATTTTVTTKPAAKPTVTTTTTTTKPAVTVTAKPMPANGVVLKKDGTPDKRYNKVEVKEGPVKKDGTPDKRYKANKKG